jgi:hypothetical protein
MAIAAIPVFLILAGSDGTEPRGLCEFVTGSNGLLALNPNSGGTVQYSCDLNWTQFASYILPPAILLLYPAWRIVRRITRRREYPAP